MSGFKHDALNDRLQTARAAKQAMLEKFRAKPDANDPAVLARQAERKATAEARAARQAERERERKAEAERKLAASAEAAAAEAAQRAAREAEAKAARDARYAARKARKK